MLIHYQPGDKVTVTGGPLKGAIGSVLYTFKSNAQLTLNVKGREEILSTDHLRPTRATVKKAGVL